MTQDKFIEALKRIGHYSSTALDFIVDRFDTVIDETPDADAESLARSIYECSNEYASEAEALASCEYDSDLCIDGEFVAPDREYLERTYCIDEAVGVFMLYNILPKRVS